MSIDPQPVLNRPRHRDGRVVRRRQVTAVAGAATAVAAVVSLTLAHPVAQPPAAVADRVPQHSGARAAQAKAGSEDGPTAAVNVTAAVKAADTLAHQPLPDLAHMSLQTLQTYSAKMQAQFVQASLAYQAARTQSAQATAAAAKATDVETAARHKEQVTRAAFAATVSDTYQSGVGENPTLQLLTSANTNSDDFVQRLTTAEQVTSARSDLALEASRSATEAEHASVAAVAARATAAQAQSDAATLLDDIQGRAASVAAAVNKALTTAAASVQFASAQQQARNDAALKNWRSYLDALDAAHVVPPAARSLRRPAARLPFGLAPLLDGHRHPIAGVAARRIGHGKKITTLPVLPRETIAAVSRAFAALGKPYVGGNSGPATYDCVGLSRAAYNPTGYRVPTGDPVDQYRNLHHVSPSSAQVGDLVFFAQGKDGIQQVGLNLGGKLMLTADATTAQVGVEPYPGHPAAFARPVLPRNGVSTAPPSPHASPLRCGGTAYPVSANGFGYPMAASDYTIGVGFGVPGPMWSSGYHTGQDFVAPTGTQVVASRAGIAHITPTSWGGPYMITIDHGNGVETVYAHLSKDLITDGQQVQGGQPIALSGAMGNVTGPHLHFEVHVDGVAVDPMPFLTGGTAADVPGGTPTATSPNAGWGGYSNGMIPATALCPLAGHPGQQLRCDAAAAWAEMAKAFQKQFGTPMCITDSYRSYAVQVQTFQNKPTLAAVPGTSNHGWALAVDLCGGINSYSTPQYAWMVAHASQFGWLHPNWARQGGGREEPWHWEFGNIS